MLADNEGASGEEEAPRLFSMGVAECRSEKAKEEILSLKLTQSRPLGWRG